MVFVDFKCAIWTMCVSVCGQTIVWAFHTFETGRPTNQPIKRLYICLHCMQKLNRGNYRFQFEAKIYFCQLFLFIWRSLMHSACILLPVCLRYTICACVCGLIIFNCKPNAFFICVIYRNSSIGEVIKVYICVSIGSLIARFCIWKRYFFITHPFMEIASIDF